MNDLRLNQTIYANSTCYFDGEIVEICKTTLKDATSHSNGKVEIKLGGGHNWGCIPTRSRDNIIANESDIRPFIERKIARKNDTLSQNRIPTNLSEQLEQGKTLLVVEERRDEIILYAFELYQTYNSLLEGKTIEFRQKFCGSGYKSLKLKDLDKLPKNTFNNIDDAIQYMENLIKINLD